MSAENKIRLNLEVTSKVRQQLEDLQRRSGAASFTEVIRRALALYDAATDLQENRGTIVFERPDGTRELLRLF